MIKSSEYILKQRHEFSLYVLSSRAIPHLADGMKSATRRVLWMARDGKKTKSSALAGACAVLHPHAAPEGSINTAAAPYGNNMPLLTGYGSFGTLLSPTAYGAARYTSVILSQFSKMVVFRDVDLITMVDNYDSTTTEPKHFIPLIPLVLLNPQEGIAIGFASNILPRAFTDIVSDQIKHLSGTTNITEALPTFTKSDQVSHGKLIDKAGKERWLFKGDYTKPNATTIIITNLPYGLSHKKLTTKLDNLLDTGNLLSVVDDSTDTYCIKLKFKKGILSKLDKDDTLALVGLVTKITENLNVVDFDGITISHMTYTDIITKYTDWRLQYYIIRYQTLLAQLVIDIQRLRDILLAIKKNVGSAARKIKSKQELLTFLQEIGIVHISYIADLPIYRFTEEERDKTNIKLQEYEITEQTYNDIIDSEEKRKLIYISELKEIKKVKITQ